MTKAVFRVSIDDTAIVEFQQKMEEIEKGADRIPDAWREVGEIIDEIGVKQKELTEDAREQEEAVDRGTKAGKDIEYKVDVFDRRIRGSFKDAKGVAKEIVGATASLRSWAKLTAVFGLVVGSGGLFGINRMAAGVTERRATALGYGISMGQKTAFDIQFNRYGNTDAILAGFTGALTDPEQSSALTPLIGPIRKGDTAATAFARALPELKRLADNTDPRVLGSVVKARGLEQLGISTQMMLTLRATSPGTSGDSVSDFNRTASSLDMPPEVSRAWVDLEAGLSEARSNIATVLGRNLVGLTPGLIRSSQVFSDVISAFLNMPETKFLFKGAGDSFKKWADSLSTPAAEKEWKDLVGEGSAAVRMIDSIMAWIGAHPKAAGGILAAIGAGAALSMLNPLTLTAAGVTGAVGAGILAGQKVGQVAEFGFDAWNSMTSEQRNVMGPRVLMDQQRRNDALYMKKMAEDAKKPGLHKLPPMMIEKPGMRPKPVAPAQPVAKLDPGTVTVQDNTGGVSKVVVAQ